MRSSRGSRTVRAGSSVGASSWRAAIARGRDRHSRCRAGRLRLVHRGVYAVGHDAIPIRGRLVRRRCSSPGPAAALSHRTAAYVLTLLPSMPPFVEVTTTRGRRRNRPGLVFHHATDARHDTPPRPPGHHPHPHPPRPRRDPARARGRARGERGARAEAHRPRRPPHPAGPGLRRPGQPHRSPDPEPARTSLPQSGVDVRPAATADPPPHRPLHRRLLLAVPPPGGRDRRRPLPRPPAGPAPRRPQDRRRCTRSATPSCASPRTSLPARPRASPRRSAVQRRVQRLDAREDLVRHGLLLVARRIRRSRSQRIASP